MKISKKIIHYTNRRSKKICPKFRAKFTCRFWRVWFGQSGGIWLVLADRSVDSSRCQRWLPYPQRSNWCPIHRPSCIAKTQIGPCSPVSRSDQWRLGAHCHEYFRRSVQRDSWIMAIGMDTCELYSLRTNDKPLDVQIFLEQVQHANHLWENEHFMAIRM